MRIGHIDMDAFFASVYERNHPEHKTKPIIIGANPKDGRGVVSTANYQARKYGVKSGMPISQAYKLCPHGHYVQPKFSEYRTAHDDVMKIVKNHVDKIQIVGLDEAYFDITNKTKNWTEARKLANKIKNTIKKKTGLTASIGIAETKSAAKIASDLNKPDGVCIIKKTDFTKKIHPLPVKSINGCGPKTTQLLKSQEIYTIGDLAKTPKELLQKWFGKHGGWLYEIANGIDNRNVTTQEAPNKSHSQEHTFTRDITSPTQILKQLQNTANKVLLEHGEVDIKTITIKIRYSDFATLTRSHTPKHPLNPKNQETKQQIQQIITQLAKPLVATKPVRLIGVKITNYTNATNQQTLNQFN